MKILDGTVCSMLLQNNTSADKLIDKNQITQVWLTKRLNQYTFHGHSTQKTGEWFQKEMIQRTLFNFQKEYDEKLSSPTFP